MKVKITLALLFASLAAVTLLSAYAVEDRLPEQTNAQPAANQTNQSDIQMMQHMQEMDTMAKSIKSMADVCRMMMEKEMRSRPLKMAALSVLGTLGVAALALFVALEIQWIRFWSVRIKTERLQLTGTKPS